MKFPLYEIDKHEYGIPLAEIPTPPEKVYVRGVLPPRGTKCLAVVGSRHYTNYAPQVIEYLIQGIKNYPISIISGLAIGVDSLAHKSALTAGLHTLAVPGSGISDEALYPRQNLSLAHKILEHGGGLLSEFEPNFKATPWSFPQRNRIMAGLSDAVLLIEATEKSGTLITARLTVDYNRELLVVPGNIFSENSKGVHQFLKLGATPVTHPDDIIIALGLTLENETMQIPNIHSLTEDEQAVLAILSEPRDHDTIIRLLPHTPEASLSLLMHMELSGHIHEQNGLFYKT